MTGCPTQTPREFTPSLAHHDDRHVKWAMRSNLFLTSAGRTRTVNFSTTRGGAADGTQAGSRGAARGDALRLAPLRTFVVGEHVSSVGRVQGVVDGCEPSWATWRPLQPGAESPGAFRVVVPAMLRAEGAGRPQTPHRSTGNCSPLRESALRCLMDDRWLGGVPPCAWSR